jgi:hypothetical protein
MRELRPGTWYWQSPHPDWNEEEWWPELVSWYAIELGDDVVLFDPLSVPGELPSDDCGQSPLVYACPVFATAPRACGSDRELRNDSGAVELAFAR